MRIDLSLLISIISVTCVIIFGVLTATHNGSGDINQRIADAAQKAAENAEIKTMLNSIQSDTRDIKDEQSGLRKTIEDMNTRLVVVEKSTEEAHQKIAQLQQHPIE